MAKKYILKEAGDDNGEGLIVILIALLLILLLAPGMLLTSIVNIMVDMQCKTLWAWSIVFSIITFGICAFLADWTAYLWTALVSAVLMLLIHLFSDNSFIAYTLSVMF